MSFAPRDQQAEVVDDRRRFAPEWYSWLVELCGIVSPSVTTVDGLPSAQSAGIGARRFVTDAADTTFMSVVTGGGTSFAPVVSDGADWLVG